MSETYTESPGVSLRNARKMPAVGRQKTTAAGFAAVIAYAILDYARPMDVVTPLSFIHPGLWITLLLVILLLANARSVPFSERRIQIFGVLLLFMTAWVPFALNNHFALSVAVTFFQIATFVVGLLTFVNSRDRLRTFEIWWIISICAQALWGLTHGGHGTGSIFDDENDLAMASCIGLPLVYFHSRRASSISGRVALYGAMGLLLSSIIASRSRGGFVGLVMVSGVIWLMSTHKVRAILQVLIGAAIFAALAPDSYWNRMNTISDANDATRNERIYSWGIGWRAFMDNPLLGVGQGNMPWHMGIYADPDYTGPGLGGRQTHSIYLTLLPELGLFGTSLFVWLLVLHARSTFWIIRRGRRRGLPPGYAVYDSTARGVLSATVGYLVCGIFLSTLWYPHLYYLIALSAVSERLAAQEARARRLQQPPTARERPPIG